MVWESLAAWYAWMDSNSRRIFAQGSWLYDPCASSLSRLRCLRIASSYHDISLPLACAWQQPSGLTNFTVATGILFACLIWESSLGMHLLGRYGRACGVASVSALSQCIRSQRETRAETVVLPASHVQISGSVLNFLRLLLVGGAAAARRRASGTY